MGSKLQFEKFLFALTLIALSFSFTYFTVFAGRKQRFPLVKTMNSIRMTAMECIDLDKTFSTFSVCSLKPINRTLKILNVRVILHKTPVTNTTARFQMLKKGNNYNPFGMDAYLDYCKYMKGKKNPVVDWFYNIWLPYTNVNHSCPFSEDIIVDNLPLIDLYPLPSVFPEGRYRIDLKVYAYNKPRAYVKLYLDIVERRNDVW